MFGKYTGFDYTIELQEDVKPYHAKPFPIRILHKVTPKKQVSRLIKNRYIKENK